MNGKEYEKTVEDEKTKADAMKFFDAELKK